MSPRRALHRAPTALRGLLLCGLLVASACEKGEGTTSPDAGGSVRTFVPAGAAWGRHLVLVVYTEL